MYQLASKTFTTPSFSGTKPYAFLGSANPVGIVGGDEESIGVLEVRRTSNNAIQTEAGNVRTGTFALSPHIVGRTANLSGGVSYIVSFYVGLKNFDPNTGTNTLGFSQGYVQAIGLSV